MEHGSLCNLISWQVSTSTLPPGAKTLQFASLNFDVSFQEMFSTWCSGGTLIVMPGELRQDPSSLLRYLEKESINRLFLPFVALQQLAGAANEQRRFPKDLREVITAGEQLRITPAVAGLFGRLGNCRLYNQYGPTESHVVTAFELSGAPGEWPSLPPIGRPIANTSIYLLDRDRKPVPVGVAGELYIGGECLSRGYIHRPELTADRFIQNPFRSGSGVRLYRTGDVARYLADGNIEYLGRSDNQVKIRGFRIELGEIEAAIIDHPQIRECVVIARPDEAGDKRLLAYLVAVGDDPPLPREIRSFLERRLPAYMVPSAFVVLASLPLTSNGKVDRKALPEPDLERPALENTYQEPRTPIEELVASIWSDVLGLKKVGIHDNFFDLGGHSLLATQVVSRLSKVLHVETPLRFLFEAPTPAGLAVRITQNQAENADPEELARILDELTDPLAGLKETDDGRYE
jgi:acyl-coenzyme A synthetase/AMP-(fatty) acid ligase/acyl carrier protein